MNFEQQLVVDRLRAILDDNVNVFPAGHQNRAGAFAGNAEYYETTMRQMIFYSRMTVHEANISLRHYDTILRALPLVRRIFAQGLLRMDDPVRLQSYSTEELNVNAGENAAGYEFQVEVPQGVQVPEQVPADGA